MKKKGFKVSALVTIHSMCYGSAVFTGNLFDFTTKGLRKDTANIFYISTLGELPDSTSYCLNYMFYKSHQP
ncbi:hypothetical protein S83_009358 [Arachis hypogaea]